MANIDRTAITPYLKELYPDGPPAELVFKKCPTLALLEKDEDFEGESYELPLTFGDPQGRSATAATASAVQTAGKYTKFQLTTVNDYHWVTIDGDVIDATRSNKGAFIRALKQGMDGGFRQISRSLHHAIFRNGGGALAQIDYVATALTFTLKNPSDNVHFEVGMTLQASATDGTSGAVRVGSQVITAINRQTGVITGAAAWDTAITGFADEDFVFASGDFGIKIKGFDAWLPSAAPGATLFFGVDRSVDTQRLGGVRYDGSAQTIEEASIDGAERVAEAGGSPDCFIVHPRQFANLAKLLGSKVQYGRKDTAVKMATGATLGFRTIVIDGPTGPIDVVADYNCQPTVGWMKQLDTWMLVSMGGVPKVFDYDGLASLRTAGDALEIRTLYRAQIGCSAPGYNGRITLPAL
jgi:hypothetical protein